MFDYSINQFQVKSDIALPAAQGTSAATAVPLAVSMRQRNLHEFPQCFWIGKRDYGFLRAYDVGTGILIAISDTVRMFIARDGSRIDLDYEESSARERDFAAACTINLGTSACTLLRGDLPLHGASVEINGKLCCIMAPSGTGKSTLLWSLLDQGARFVCDDVLPITIANGKVTATPSRGLHAKLSETALRKRGKSVETYTEIFPGAGEYWVPLPPEQRLLRPRLLDAVFVLQPFQSPEVPGRVLIRRHSGAEALTLLLDNTQGLWAVCDQLDARRLCAQYLSLAQVVPIYTIAYHRCFEMLPTLNAIICDLLHPVASKQSHRPVRIPAGAAQQQWESI